MTANELLTQARQVAGIAILLAASGHNDDATLAWAWYWHLMTEVCELEAAS